MSDFKGIRAGCEGQRTLRPSDPLMQGSPRNPEVAAAMTGTSHQGQVAHNSANGQAPRGCVRGDDGAHPATAAAALSTASVAPAFHAISSNFVEVCH